MSLCSLLTYDASIRSLAKKWVVESFYLCQLQKAFLVPFLCPSGYSSQSLSRWDPEHRQAQAGYHLGRIHPFTLVLSFTVSVRMVSSWAPQLPRGSTFSLVCLAVNQRQKGILPSNGFLCYVFCLSYIFKQYSKTSYPPYNDMMAEMCLKIFYKR